MSEFITINDLSDIFIESVRFSSHIFFLHLLSFIINEEEELFGMKLLKTLILTTLAIILYNITVKKIIYTDKKKEKK